ncbi:interferon-induced, double-stranded RNA-activated protein kinase isoform X1 [Elgaria multicarinata webbii]
MAVNQAVPHACMAKLNEYCQRNNLKAEYKDVNATGPPHDRIFTVAVVIDQRQYSEATAKTKKLARHHAAALAWEIIQQERQGNPALRPVVQPLPSPSTSTSSTLQPSKLPEPAENLTEASSPRSVNYISSLNEYANRNKVIVTYFLKDKTGLDHMPIFSYICKIDGKEFGEGTGNSAQIAKQNAAKLAYEKLILQPASTTERSATHTNGSTNRSSSDSQETSNEASVESVQESMEVASDRSESIAFRSSGVYSNGTDFDSKYKDAGDRPANKIDAVYPSEISSSSLASPKGHAVKPKRKEKPLAPKFSKSTQSKYTINARFLEDFEDIEKIGSGAFGNVFKAKHAIDKTLYAVKRVKLIVGEEKESEKEVKALKILVHENIVRYYNCWIGKDNLPSDDSTNDNRNASQCNCLFIMTDYCEKGTLKDWLPQESSKGYEDDALIKFQQIVKGVEFIHKENLIHRDLKPLNIFISKDDKIKIGDFGLVTTGVDDHLMQRTQGKGTVSYMAPEQMGRFYGKEVDIFPLGLILFEMLYLFKTGHERREEWDNIRDGKLPRTFTEKFSREASLIKKLLLKDPSRRPLPVDVLRFLRKEQYNPHTC